LRVSKRGYKDAAMVIPVKNSGEMYMLGRVEPVGLYQTAFNFNLEPEESAGTRQEKLASSSNTFQPKGTAAELKLGAIIYNSDANQRRVMISDIWYHEGDIFQFFDPKLMVTPKTFKIEEISSNSVKLIDTSSKDGQPITMELKIKE
jgi:hypothetical protein